jgi:phospholipase/carboxylesterase
MPQVLAQGKASDRTCSMAKYAPLTSIGPLDALVIEGDPSAPTIVLLHGYGANAWDLAPLVEALDLPFQANWYFPNAPETINNPFDPRASQWFPIDAERLQAAIREGQPVGFSAGNVDAMVRSARDFLGPFLAELAVPPEKLIVGGFSQGSMLALEWLLQQDANVRGLVLLASAPVHEESWRARAPRHAGQRFIQTHAKQDHILSIANARRLHKMLQEAGFKGGLHEGQGAHTIPSETLPALKSFLSKEP